MFQRINAFLDVLEIKIIGIFRIIISDHFVLLSSKGDCSKTPSGYPEEYCSMYQKKLDVFKKEIAEMAKKKENHEN